MSAPTATKVQLPGWPQFGPDEIKAVTDVLTSGKVNYWTGQEGRQFEKEFAAYMGTKHGIAIMNGTVTLELALIALGIGPGDEVIIPPRTFMATATAVMVRGAKPVFADIDPYSGNLSAATIEPHITTRTKAVIPVHIGGWPCEMTPILALAKAHGFAVIEDCAQAQGAEINGKRVGSFGDINSWSFCQDKVMTLGGEGGAITTDSDEYWSAMWSYKDHGKSYDAVYNRQHPPGYRWVNDGIGTNWRLTEMQSAIARVQLRKLDGWIATRRANAQVLNERFADHPMLTVPVAPAHMKHIYYRWYSYLDIAALKDGWTRDRVCGAVSERGVWCQVGSCGEIYREKAFDGTDSRPAAPLPNARAIGESSIALLTHPTLAESDMHVMADILGEVLAEAKR
jgi:dTDP-4-amino-4,6-dideoxygalactose transaminase